MEEDGDVRQLGAVSVGQPEQVDVLDVAQALFGVIDVLLELVNERRELADREVAPRHVVDDGQRQPVHALRRRVQQRVQRLEVTSQDVHLHVTLSITLTDSQFMRFDAGYSSVYSALR